MKKLTTAAITAGALTAFLVPAGIAHAVAKPSTTYASCAALNKHYTYGVGLPQAVDHSTRKGYGDVRFTKNRAVYLANAKRDSDHDGIACERLATRIKIVHPAPTVTRYLPGPTVTRYVRLPPSTVTRTVTVTRSSSSSALPEPVSSSSSSSTAPSAPLT